MLVLLGFDRIHLTKALAVWAKLLLRDKLSWDILAAILLASQVYRLYQRAVHTQRNFTYLMCMLL